MPSPLKSENTVRRLFRESELRQRGHAMPSGTDSVADIETDLATTLSRVEGAAAEMRRLRAMAFDQQTLIYDQKKDLATVRREVADALDQAIRADRLYQSEKIRAELSESRVEQLEREVIALRAHITRLTVAVDRSFDQGEKIVALRVVA